jgi:hypothetical protein
MIDNKFRTDLQALVTAFLEGGGARSVAVDAMDEIGRSESTRLNSSHRL